MGPGAWWLALNVFPFSFHKFVEHVCCVRAGLFLRVCIVRVERKYYFKLMVPVLYSLIPARMPGTTSFWWDSTFI